MGLVSSLLEFLPVVLNEGNILWYLYYTSISDFSLEKIREITSRDWTFCLVLFVSSCCVYKENTWYVNVSFKV